VSKRTYGILAGIIGSAVGAWWFARRRRSTSPAFPDRGTVIFDNTPTATDLSAGIV
jgi:hypothetical protein